MSGPERRRQTRARCAIPCDLIVGGAAVAGEVRNVSAGGLGVLADAPALEQGESVTVALHMPGGTTFEVHTLVWHARAVRRAGGDKAIRSWGLVLSDASPEFAALVERLVNGRRGLAPQRAPARTAESTHPSVSSPKPLPELPPPPPPLQQFAIRIQQIGKPRTCRVVACGATREAALAAALAEVGAGWEVLDACPLP